MRSLNSRKALQQGVAFASLVERWLRTRDVRVSPQIVLGRAMELLGAHVGGLGGDDATLKRDGKRLQAMGAALVSGGPARVTRALDEGPIHLGTWIEQTREAQISAGLAGDVRRHSLLAALGLALEFPNQLNSGPLIADTISAALRHVADAYDVSDD